MSPPLVNREEREAIFVSTVDARQRQLVSDGVSHSLPPAWARRTGPPEFIVGDRFWVQRCDKFAAPPASSALATVVAVADGATRLFNGAAGARFHVRLTTFAQQHFPASASLLRVRDLEGCHIVSVQAGAAVVADVSGAGLRGEAMATEGEGEVGWAGRDALSATKGPSASEISSSKGGAAAEWSAGRAAWVLEVAYEAARHDDDRKVALARLPAILARAVSAGATWEAATEGGLRDAFESGAFRKALVDFDYLDYNNGELHIQ